MRIGVISAMDMEHEQLTGLLEDKIEKTDKGFHFTEGKIGDNTFILTQCGIGKVNAAVGATELIRACEPDCIISTGVAGGIDTCLQVMDVVVSSRIVYHDVWCGDGNAYGQIQGLPLYFEGNATLLKHATQLEQQITNIHAGLICSGDKFITDRKELDAIKAEFPEGLAVDMESGAIAHVCHLFKIPFISFRIISDTPGAENHFEQYLNFWGEMADRSFKVTHAFLSSLPNRI